MKQEPPPDAKCRDKFLVQSIAVTADKEFANISAVVSWPLTCLALAGFAMRERDTD